MARHPSVGIDGARLRADDSDVNTECSPPKRRDDERERGLLADAAWEGECERVRALLRASTEPHHAEFLEQWNRTGNPPTKS